jgi:hypothetical protein
MHITLATSDTADYTASEINLQQATSSSTAFSVDLDWPINHRTSTDNDEAVDSRLLTAGTSCRY